jgi:hypothetical protein
MTDAEQITEWAASANPINSLCAIYENGGERMLSAVLKRNGLASVLELVKVQSAADKELGEFETQGEERNLKKRSPTLRSLKARCWKLFSEWIRRKDADAGGTENCYTCGKLAHWKELHAGHALPGRTNAVLFDPDIVRPQCPVCNIWKGGNYPIFTTKLIKENGMAWWESKLEGARAVVKYTRSDLEEMIVQLKQKIEGLHARNP